MQGKKVNFKKAKIPLRKKIVGEHVILEPINISKHANQLFHNFSKDKKNKIWKYLPYGPFKNIRDFKSWLLKNCQDTDPFFYAIYAKRHQQHCGMASYLRIIPIHGSIEVGHINYSPLLQNTLEGTEAMYLMMSNAFDQLGNRRYEWKCNNLNKDSKKAALRLGFTYEGIFRQMNVFKGRNRDTAWFSVIDTEWNSLKKKYLKYLSPKNFDENFIQKQKL